MSITTFVDHIYVICSPEYEPSRFPMMKHLVDSLGVSDSHSFLCPTYKTTITDEIMNQYVKQNSVHTILRRRDGMRKSEISLFLNFRHVLETIRRNYTEGMFLTFESDVISLNNSMPQLLPFLSAARDSLEQWDVIDIGSNTAFSGRRNQTYMGSDAQLSLLSRSGDSFVVTRMLHTRCTDSLLWSYSGVVKFLNYLETFPFYEYPLDYYMDEFFHNHPGFRFYWSNASFFIQTSNLGICPSTIK
jgi:hypothetical protein